MKGLKSSLLEHNHEAARALIGGARLLLHCQATIMACGGLAVWGSPMAVQGPRTRKRLTNAWKRQTLTETCP